MNRKIVNNYISRQKANLTARAGILLLGDFLKNEENVKYELDLNFGRDYNTRIYMEKANKYKNEYNYIIEGVYQDNKRTLYIKNDN
ncbi:MAG: hypothetical protein U5K53_07925 [Halanaerobiales bacterium]|nr:hypothetical protein [Halanaerobiales bacterium]